MFSMNNINFLAWASVLIVQLFALDKQRRQIRSLESDNVTLSQRLVNLEFELDKIIALENEIEKLDSQIRQRLIKEWELDDDFDPR